MSNDDLLSRRPRTKRVFSNEDMARMRDLYYDPNIPMAEAADAFGVPSSTLMRWIIEMRWPRKSSGWRPPGMAPRHERVAADEAAPHPNPLPASGEREESPTAPPAAAAPVTPLDPNRLALEIAAHARVELAAMGEAGGPLAANLTLAERKRRADIIASLSRSIARIDKTFEARAEREALKRLVKKLKDKVYALENAGVIETQRQALAALKEEFNRQR